MTDKTDIELLEKLSELKSTFFKEISKSIIGQHNVLDHILIALLCKGHTLIVGVPGLAKTLMIKSLADILNLNFKRIQFTPDLMPSDITGTEVIEEDQSTGKRSFRFFQGPIFGNIILADEINRTPPKTQAALLESMQEHKVTASGHTYDLEEPFFVLATQNPIEQEGTYPLPEAQMDRFMFKLKVTYPSRQEERAIMDRVDILHEIDISPVVSKEEILEAREVVNQVYVEDKAKDYIVDIVQAARNPEQYGMDIGHWIEYGASPRATIYLQQAARALAFMQGEGNVFPNDVKQVAMDILRHRVVCTYEAEAEDITSEDIIRKILDSVPVP